MAKQSPPLDLTVSLTFSEKVPLVKRRELFDRIACLVTDYVESDAKSDLEIIETCTVECAATNQFTEALLNE
jgi:hypothetical protein